MGDADKCLPLPGHLGLPVLGDKSLPFYRDPVAFVDNKIKEYQSPVFLSRFLNKPTVFVTSNAVVKEMLTDKSSSFELGYKTFMEDIYGDNILFQDKCDEIKGLLHNLLCSPELISNFEDGIKRISTQHLSQLSTTPHVPVYPFMKHLATELCIHCFLGVDRETSADLANRIQALCTTHWHGIISVPFSLKIPMTNHKSAFSKALQAKQELLSIIQERLEACNPNQFPCQLKQCLHGNHLQAANHLLLFISALVPKAIASILTSFVLATANKKKYLDQAESDPDMLQCLLLEVQRLWPPFFAGRRVAKQAVHLQGYSIPRGHAVLSCTYHAHRDPQVFSDPNDFMPCRWQSRNKDDKDKLVAFGGGPRKCLGQVLVDSILKSILVRLCDSYRWDIEEGSDLTYKWLPVCRPTHDVMVTFTPRSFAMETVTMATTEMGDGDRKLSQREARDECNNEETFVGD